MFLGFSGEQVSHRSKPIKRAGGRRYYRPNTICAACGNQRLLHEDGPERSKAFRKFPCAGRAWDVCALFPPLLKVSPQRISPRQAPPSDMAPTARRMQSSPMKAPPLCACVPNRARGKASKSSDPQQTQFPSARATGRRKLTPHLFYSRQSKSEAPAEAELPHPRWIKHRRRPAKFFLRQSDDLAPVTPSDNRPDESACCTASRANQSK